MFSDMGQGIKFLYFWAEVMNDLKFVTHFSVCNMGNIIRKTVQEEVEKSLSPTSAKTSRKRSETSMANLLAKIRKRESPQESKLKKVHIKWKRFCIVRNAEHLLPQKKDGGFRFIHLALEATKEDLKKKAIEVFFPESVNHFGKKADECILTFTDAGDNIVTTEMSIKDYLHKKGIISFENIFCDAL